MTTPVVVPGSGDAGADPERDASHTPPDVAQPDGGSASDDAAPPDGSQSDAAPPPNPVEVFFEAHLLAYCDHFEQVCNASNPTFDHAKCVSMLRNSGGFQGMMQGVTPAGISAGNYALQQVQAQACLAGLSQLTFPVVGAAEWKAVTEACFAAVEGTLPQGASCAAAIDCQPNLYCDFGNVTGAVCAPVLSSGATCGQAPYGVFATFSSAECSYKGGSAGGAFCNSDFAQGPLGCDPQLGDCTCEPLRADNEWCYTDNECASGVCGLDGLCGQQLDLSSVCEAMKL
jgi:hypothetical protein